MKTSPHRQAILVFGVIIPFLLITAVFMAVFTVRGKLKRNFEAKVAGLEGYKNALAQVNELEAFMTTDQRREKAIHWTSKLEQDVVESLTKNLDMLLAKYDPAVLRQTEMGQAGGIGGLGAKCKYPHTRMQLTFEGGFKPMQLLLAELETEMPQLLLETLSVYHRPGSSLGEKGTLQFAVVYLCWEKPKEAPVAP
ncbi:MAG: hypothetical protein KGR69_05475 [Verrucomicrobia bacterium]|nr:hypothetical protein [Verrucomicrobiota bacterium]